MKHHGNTMEKTMEIMNITIKMHSTPFDQRTKACRSTEMHSDAAKCIQMHEKSSKIRKEHEKT